MSNLSQRIAQRVVRSWYHSPPDMISQMCLPLTVPYSIALHIKSHWHRQRNKTHQKAKAVVIVVGNLVVGGSGKTPIVIAIVEYLRKMGYRPAVVSRGYGGSAPSYPWRVHPHHHPHVVGDEALLLAQYAPTLIDPKRQRAVDALAGEHAVIVSDDGLQHWAMRRHIEIVVIDAKRQFGNGRLLPAGPLRESLSRLKKVDFIISAGDTSPPMDQWQMQVYAHSWHSVYQYTQKSISASLFSSYNTKVHAIAGIAYPEKFFTALTQLGLQPIEHPFPDHYQFSAHDFNFTETLPIVMTEKDAVKCRHLQPRNDYMAKNTWMLRVKAQMSSDFYQALNQKVTAHL